MCFHAQVCVFNLIETTEYMLTRRQNSFAVFGRIFIQWEIWRNFCGSNSNQSDKYIMKQKHFTVLGLLFALFYKSKLKLFDWSRLPYYEIF